MSRSESMAVLFSSRCRDSEQFMRIPVDSGQLSAGRLSNLYLHNSPIVARSWFRVQA
jgi:hypothetical protein